jgi:hypothetical protein
MTALTPSRMRRPISFLVNLLSSSRSIPPSMLNPQNTRHYQEPFWKVKRKSLFLGLPSKSPCTQGAAGGREGP